MPNPLLETVCSQNHPSQCVAMWQYVFFAFPATLAVVLLLRDPYPICLWKGGIFIQMSLLFYLKSIADVKYRIYSIGSFSFRFSSRLSRDLEIPPTVKLW